MKLLIIIAISVAINIHLIVKNNAIEHKYKYLIDLKRKNCYNLKKFKEEIYSKYERLKVDNGRLRMIHKRHLQRPENRRYLANLKKLIKEARNEVSQGRDSEVHSEKEAGIN